MIVQIFFVYFGVNILFGVTLIPNSLDLGAFTLGGAAFAGILALGFNEGAYMREIIRAGIDSVDSGQTRGGAVARHDTRPRDAAHRPAAGGASHRPAARQRVQQHAQDDVAAVLHRRRRAVRGTRRSATRQTFKPVEYFAAVAVWYLLLTTIWTRHPGADRAAGWRPASVRGGAHARASVLRGAFSRRAYRGRA